MNNAGFAAQLYYKILTQSTFEKMQTCDKYSLSQHQ
jgi:hypothetical protein